MTIVRVARVERRPFFTPKALAEYLAISERTIRDMLSRQRIPSYKVEGQRRIDPADAEKYLAPNRNGWNLKLRRDAQDAIRRVLSVMVEDRSTSGAQASTRSRVCGCAAAILV